MRLCYTVAPSEEAALGTPGAEQGSEIIQGLGSSFLLGLRLYQGRLCVSRVLINPEGCLCPNGCCPPRQTGGATLLDKREESSLLLFSPTSNIFPYLSRIWQLSMFTSQVFPRTWWGLGRLLDLYICRALLAAICLYHKVLIPGLNTLFPHSLSPVPSADLWLVSFTVEPETAVAPQQGSSYVRK